MTTITIEELQMDVRGLFSRVAAGETILISDHNQVLAEIKPILSGGGQSRPYGLAQGEFVVPDDFDDPLPEEILRLFEGKSE